MPVSAARCARRRARPPPPGRHRRRRRRAARRTPAARCPAPRTIPPARRSATPRARVRTAAGRGDRCRPRRAWRRGGAPRRRGPRTTRAGRRRRSRRRDGESSRAPGAWRRLRPSGSVERGANRQGGDDRRLGIQDLGKSRGDPRPRHDVLRQAHEQRVMARLGPGQVGVERAQVRIGQGLGEEAETLAGARLDDAEDQQAVEQVLARRRRLRTRRCIAPMYGSGASCASAWPRAPSTAYTRAKCSSSSRASATIASTSERRSGC